MINTILGLCIINTLTLNPPFSLRKARKARLRRAGLWCLCSDRSSVMLHTNRRAMACEGEAEWFSQENTKTFNI